MGNRLLTAECDEVIAFLKLEQMKDGIRDIRELPDDQGYEDSHLFQNSHTITKQHSTCSYSPSLGGKIKERTR